MERLLVLGGIEPAEKWTTQAHGRLMHLELGSGPPLVLIQGGGGGAANWYRLMGPLSARRRVLAPELPGFGLSDALVPKPPLALQAALVMADWLDAVVPGERVDLVATSFGGLVALRLAEMLPQRIGRIGLLNSTGLGRGVALPIRVAGLPLIRQAVARPSRKGTAVLFERLLTSDRSELPPEHVDALIDYAWRSAVLGAGQELALALGGFAGVRGQHEVLTSADLGAVECPVLILWGSADRFLPPRHGARAAATLRRGTFAPLAGVGHSPNWEAPGAVLDALRRFLDIA